MGLVMKVHSLKTWPDQFQAVVDGLKTFDMRRGIFDIDDILLLREWDPEFSDYTDSHRWVLCVVKYVLQGPIFDIPAGCVIMSLGLCVVGQVGGPSPQAMVAYWWPGACTTATDPE